MAPDPDRQTAVGLLQPKQVYLLAVICLLAGLSIGYVCAGSGSAASPAQAVVSAATHPAGNPAGNVHAVTLADMKRMADQQAAPLFRQLNSNPDNTEVLTKLGAIYHMAHQYGEAASWYQRAVQSDPRNPSLHTRLATSLYREGDVDGALAQLNEALKIDPKNANALFNLGMIRLQGKADGRGAVAAWRRLLVTNPQLSADRRASVEKLIAEVTVNLNQQGRSVSR